MKLRNFFFFFCTYKVFLSSSLLFKQSVKGPAAIILPLSVAIGQEIKQQSKQIAWLTRKPPQGVRHPGLTTPPRGLDQGGR